MAEYKIFHNDKEVGSKKRIDHAQGVFDKIKLAPGESKQIKDQDGKVIANTAKSQKTETGAKATKPAKAPRAKAERKKRVHDNGDEIAIMLRPLTLKEIADKARELVKSADLKPKARDEKLFQIKGALDRAEGRAPYEGLKNPGSARMSLGLMIRALLKIQPANKDALATSAT